MLVNRRVFVGSLAAAAAVRVARAQEPSPWKSPVLDGHLHLRREVAANIAHMDGCGVTKAVILARDTAADQINEARKQSATRLVWASSTDITTPGSEARLTEAVKKGAVGFAEMKFHVAADSAEFQRIYALAGELGVPIMIHFQEVPHFEGEGVFATGFKQFEAMLKKYPKTRFVGHADAFWANLDARYANEAAYPTGPITRGGVTDKLLGDYANLFGDLSANSGNNALSRDPQFTAGLPAPPPGQTDVRQRLLLRRRERQRRGAGQQSRPPRGWPANAWRAKRSRCCSRPRRPRCSASWSGRTHRVYRTGLDTESRHPTPNQGFFEEIGWELEVGSSPFRLLNPRRDDFAPRPRLGGALHRVAVHRAFVLGRPERDGDDVAAHPPLHRRGRAGRGRVGALDHLELLRQRHHAVADAPSALDFRPG